MDLELFKQRSEIIRHIRSFFYEKNYLELDTPALSPDLIPESCLEVFETLKIHPNGSKVPLYLIPSPEIYMKKFIARNPVNVFQICRCFRNGESSGFMHNPEFTMLEYYTVNAGYTESLVLTEKLFFSLAEKGFSADLKLREPFKLMSVNDAFINFAGFDLFKAVAATGELEKIARELGIESQGLDKAVLYDLIFIHVIEPKLEQFGPLVLFDYPAFVPCLAKKNKDGETFQRWELYYKGIELANCFSEETDPKAIHDFFANEAKAREKTGRIKHKVDTDYWKMFEKNKGIPNFSGVALGLDRLIMTLCGFSTIDSILPFPLADACL